MKQYQKRNTLDEYKTNKLEELPNWKWIPDNTNKIKSFEESYNQLKEWIEKHQKLPNHHSTNKEEASLGNFCRLTKKKYKNDILDKDKTKKMNELGEIWKWNQTDKILEKCNKLKEFMEKNNSLPKINSNNEEEKKLAELATNLKTSYRKKTLSENMIKYLEKIKIWKW